ncbi:MAG TPA: hypothetical protein VK211_10860 [Kamptonema sp.]|nr:hypothetical protein [Kamptonema sp.]
MSQHYHSIHNHKDCQILRSNFLKDGNGDRFFTIAPYLQRSPSNFRF